MSLQTGQVLNRRYRIVKLLGQGGFGAVYRAWDTVFSMPCALKENSDITPGAQRQFQREAQILHTLRHPNLPLVKDYFIIPGQGQYLVMDFIEGEDLQVIMAGSDVPLPEARVLDWLAEICSALSYLHSQQSPVIHRDVKPANIKISPDGKAVLVDFGIFKFYDPDAPTTQGARAVTPGYAPFEQYGNAPTDARTDIYALGATAYALLTGEVPGESITRMTGTMLPPPREFNPDLSPQVEDAILKAMQVMPEQRYQSVDDFYHDLSASGAPADLTTESAVGEQVVTVTAASAEVVQASPKTDGSGFPETAGGWPTSSETHIPDGSQSSKRRKTSILVAILLVALSAIAVIVFVVFQSTPWGNRDNRIDEEPVFHVEEWHGGIEMHAWPEPREVQVLMERDLDAGAFHGELVIFHPGEVPEPRAIEGRVESPVGEITFVDSANWFYWGWYEGGVIGGELSLDCMHCEVHGGFEFRK